MRNCSAASAGLPAAHKDAPTLLSARDCSSTSVSVAACTAVRQRQRIKEINAGCFMEVCIPKEYYTEPKRSACDKINVSRRKNKKLKSPIVAVIMMFSLLLNAAGIVFFILFLNEHGHYKSARRQKAVLERSLMLAQSSTAVQQVMSSDNVQKRSFVSQLDGNIDSLAFQAPQFVPGALDYILVVYLHGMGSNFMEPFVKPAEQTIAAGITRDNPHIGVLSCNYRHESSWGNDAAISDIVQNIREVMQEYPFKKIVIMGTSMGGCVALNFAATAPDDIKSKIAGVVSMESSGDLVSLFNRTKTGAIKPAMMVAFGGAPDQLESTYRKKSFLTNIEDFPHSARVYVLSAKADTVVPTELQKNLIDELNKRQIACHMDEIEGQHEAPSAQYYARGVRFVLGENLN